MGMKWKGSAVTKADLLIDPDVPVHLEDAVIRLGDIRVFEPCRDAWLEAKGYGLPMGWSAFIGFVRDVAAAAPQDLNDLKLALRDPDKPFEMDNLEWRSVFL